MRALLDLMRGNKAAVQAMSTPCNTLLRNATAHLAILDLAILDPEIGEEQLIKSAAAELAKLSLPLRKPSTLNPQP